MSATSPLADVALVGLAAARLTRLVTTDTLPETLVIRHLRDHAAKAPHPHSPTAVLVEGLDCPFCAGFWVCAATLGITAATNALAAAGRPGPKRLWRGIMSALALNYVVGHVSSRLDDTAHA